MMHQRLLPAYLSVLFACSSAVAQFNEPIALPAAPADTIMINGKIYTPDGYVSAMAISDGTIVALGDEAAVASRRNDSTRVIDLQGKAVYPGLHDMHAHPTGAGVQRLECNFPQGSGPNQVLDTIAKCVQESKPGEWIVGRAFDTASFGRTPPNKQMLDKAAPNNPVLLRDISGHTGWANSAALKIADITRDTPDPEGGIIERDRKGEPTGLLRESAAAPVAVKIPAPSRERNAKGLEWALNEMLAHGYTAFDDAGVDRGAAQAYADLSDQGKLKQRVRGCLWGMDNELIAMRTFFERSRFSPSCVKLGLDGVPTDGHTAAMVEPYEPLENVPHGQQAGRERGIVSITPQSRLNEMLIGFDAQGITVKMHAAGDAAVRAGLDAIEAARKANGFSGALHNVGHNSFVQMSDIKRARAISAVFEVSPYIWYPQPIIADIQKAVGAERMKRWIPVKDMLDAGALVVPGSDWPVVPTADPWIAMETLVTRQVPGGGGEILGAQERISLQQAFDMFTRAAARQMNMDYATGTIELGKFADVIVVDQDIFAVPITDVHKTKVLEVFIEGEKVFDAKDAARQMSKS